MHFKIKNTLKNNRNHIPRHTINEWPLHMPLYIKIEKLLNTSKNIIIVFIYLFNKISPSR